MHLWSFSQWFVALSLWVLPTFVEASSGITYYGRLLKPDGRPVSGNVQFRLEIRSPSPTSCLLYSETQVADLTSSAGVFSLTMNSTGSVRQDTNAWTLTGAFANRGTFNFSPSDCSSSNEWQPGTTDGRVLRVSFNAGTGWETLPPQSINFVPMAIEAYSVGGHRPQQFFRVESSGTPQTLSPWSVADYNRLLGIVAGTQGIGGDAAGFSGILAGDVSGGQATTTVTGIRNRPIATSAPLGGQVLTWNSLSNQWEPANVPVAGNPDWADITGKPSSFAPGGAAGGDLSGTYPNPSIAANAVSGGKIADGGVGFSKIAAGSASGQVLRYDGATWGAAKLNFNDLVNNSGVSPWPGACGVGQYVTWVSAVDGFQCVNLPATDWADITNKPTTVAVNTISSGAGLYLTYEPNGAACTPGQVLKWNNNRWECGADNDSATGVTSVGVSVPAYMTSTGGPVTSTGTIALGFGSQAQNSVFAGPSSGSGAPSFRSLSIFDIRADSAGNPEFWDISGPCVAGEMPTYSSALDQVSCQPYSITSSQVTSALGYTPLQSSDLSGYVPTSRTVTAGTGLSGGGDLSANRTLSIAAGGVGSTELASNAVTTAKIADGQVTDAKIVGMSADKLTSGAGLYLTYQPDGSACTPGQVLKWNNSRWECGADNDSATAETDPTVEDFAKQPPSSDFSTPSGELTLNTVPIAKGGTGATTREAALNNLLPSQGSQAGKILQTDGSNVSWMDAPATGVTSVGVSVPSYMTSTGGPVTSSGTIALGFGSQAQNSIFAGPTSGSGAPTFRNLFIADIKANSAGNPAFWNISGACPAGQMPTYSSPLDQVSCAAYSLTSSQVTTALGFTPAQAADLSAYVAKAGDTMTGTLTLASNGLNVGTNQLVATGGRIGIGTSSPHASALLDVTSTEKGILFPRMTTAQRNAISTPSAGLVIYNTTNQTLEYYNGTAWNSTQSSSLVTVSATGLTATGSGVVNFATKTDPNNEFNLTTDRFQPTTAGKYLVNYHLSYDGMADGAHYYAIIVKNGSTVHNPFQRASVYASNDVVGSTIVEMNGTTDYLEVYYTASTGNISRAIVQFYPLTTSFSSGGGSSDDLGSHIATQNLSLVNNWLSGDGDNEGIRIDSSGNVGIGLTNPSERLEVAGRIKATELCLGTDCQSSWPAAGGSGTVTEVVTGTGLTGGPITGNGTISIADGGVGTTQLADGAVTAAKLENSGVTASTYGSGSAIPTITVDAKGRITNVTTNSISGLLPSAAGVSGKYLKSDGTSWTGEDIRFSDIKNIAGTSAFDVGSCAANQTVAWSSLTDSFSCQNIGSLNASTLTAGTIDVARLPSSVTDGVWSASAGNVSRVTGSVGVGTASPAASAILDVASTSKGFLPPRMTTAQRTAIGSPADGLIVFDSDLEALFVYRTGAWAKLADSTEVSFSAHKTSNQSLTGGSIQLVDWGALRFNHGSAFNLATDRFQPTVPGRYWIHFSVYTTGLTSGTYAEPFIYKNGTQHSIALIYTPSTETMSAVSAIVDLNGTTDYLDFRVIPGSNSTLSGNSSATFAQGFLISGGTGASGAGADNLGNHVAAQNLTLGTNWLSGDGDNEGVRVDANGNVGIGTPTPGQKLSVAGTIESTSGGIRYPDSTTQATSAFGPIFSAYQVGASSVSSGGTVKVRLDTEEFDSDSTFDTSTNRFTPNKAGYYRIYLQVTFAGTGMAGFTLGTSLYKNGTIAKGVNHLINYTAPFTQTLAVSAIIYMNGTTDYLEGYYSSNGSAMNSTPGSASTYMTGEWIRP